MLGFCLPDFPANPCRYGSGHSAYMGSCGHSEMQAELLPSSGGAGGGGHTYNQALFHHSCRKYLPITPRILYW